MDIVGAARAEILCGRSFDQIILLLCSPDSFKVTEVSFHPDWIVGGKCLEAIERRNTSLSAGLDHDSFDAVVSDVRMPRWTSAMSDSTKER